MALKLIGPGPTGVTMISVCDLRFTIRYKCVPTGRQVGGMIFLRLENALVPLYSTR